MKIRKYGTSISLLLLTIVVYSYANGEPMESRSQDEPERPEQNATVRRNPHISSALSNAYVYLVKLASLIHAQSGDLPSATDRNIQHPESITHHSEEFGRENPFMPLIARNAAQEITNSRSDTETAAQPNPAPVSVIRLTAIFSATGSREGKPTAIIEEDGVSRVASVGDMMAGMTVMEIRRGEVILSKGDKKCIVTLGTLPEEIARDN